MNYNKSYWHSKELLDIFPHQIKVVDISLLDRATHPNTSSLLHKQFREPLSEWQWEKLVCEIADYLDDKTDQEVYSFFYRSHQNEVFEYDWFLCSARLNKDHKGNSKEIVCFSYSLCDLVDNKKSLYRVLENDGFFKDHFKEVALLSKREREILRLVSAGMSSKEIANAVFISVHTVNTHRRKINEKLKTKTFAELLRFAEVFDLVTKNNNKDI